MMMMMTSVERTRVCAGKTFAPKEARPPRRARARKRDDTAFGLETIKSSFRVLFFFFSLDFWWSSPPENAQPLFDERVKHHRHRLTKQSRHFFRTLFLL
jgi:hypothetical protein